MRRKKKEKINKNNVKTCNCMVAFRGAGVFCQGGQIEKKETVFFEKALPTKANFDSHAAI